MSRWRRFLANPYKTRTVSVLLTRSFRRWLVRRNLKSLTPATVSKYLNISEDLGLSIHHRDSPAFFFDPEEIPRIISAIPQAQKAAAIRQADQEALGRTFTFRYSPPVTFPAEIDWAFTVDQDPDWNRDLHRLDWLVTALLASHYTGDDKYAIAASQALEHWRQANPPGSPPWADPFEVAQRAHTLSWFLFLSLPLPFRPAWCCETALCAVLASGDWLAATLEYQTPNNHLLIEILRLYELGLLWPEYPNSRQWRHLGETLLPREIARQVLPDGFHAELSVFYHRLVLEALLEINALARRNNLALPESIRQRTGNMLNTLQLVRRPDGTYPLWGDGFQTDVLLRHDLPAAGALLAGRVYPGGEISDRTLWFLNGAWPQPVLAPLPGAHYWPDAGYAVLNRDTGAGHYQITFDCGPFGLPAAPGHGHADCLSVTLNLGPQQVLIDPGTYSFRDAGWRQAFRGTAAHNTISIDRQDQTPIPGFFDAGRGARPRVDHALISDGLRFFDASHDGYTGLTDPVWHRRLLLDLPDTGWLVIDLVTGQGEHQVDLPWHFHPDLFFPASGGTLDGLRNGRKAFQMQWRASASMTVSLQKGLSAPPFGWQSELAGLKIAAPVVTISGRVKLPAGIATLLAPPAADPNSSLHLDRTEAGFAVAITGRQNSTTVLLSLTEPAPLNQASWAAQGTIFICHQTPGTLDLVLADGATIRRDRLKLLSLPQPTRGLLLSQRPDQIQLAGAAGLPLEISSERQLPVTINGTPARSLYDPQRQVIQVTP